MKLDKIKALLGDYKIFIFLFSFMLLSVISIFQAQRFSYLSTTSLAITQSFWYLVSFITILFIARLDKQSIIEFMKKLYWPLLACLAILIIIRFVSPLNQNGFIRIFVKETKGIYAWFRIPFLGSFQPSEFMKISLLFIGASIISEHNQNKQEYTMRDDMLLFIKLAKYVLPALILNILQPDTGIPIIVIISLLFMIFVSGVKKRWFIISIMIISLIFGFILYCYYFNPSLLKILFKHDYQLNRFYGWLDTNKYQTTYGYQLYTSLTAIGAGQLKGLSTSLKVSIPEPHTDLIFSTIGASFGFIGGVITILLCLLFNFYLIKKAINCHDQFTRYIIAGLVGILAYQQIQNIGMVIGVLPITGITLPLISYGGSSLLSYMLVFGYICSLNKKYIK